MIKKIQIKLVLCLTVIFFIVNLGCGNKGSIDYKNNFMDLTFDVSKADKFLKNDIYFIKKLGHYSSPHHNKIGFETRDVAGLLISKNKKSVENGFFKDFTHELTEFYKAKGYVVIDNNQFLYLSENLKYDRTLVYSFNYTKLNASGAVRVTFVERKGDKFIKGGFIVGELIISMHEVFEK
ncbi:MAG: hypothetical protein COA79_14780 [Planctomycetota bacterium]|nr:MAG: hypothetical protein COA79_14780 [Planctomycetota bacterium]